MKFKVALKQGQKTWIEYIEAPSLEAVLSFYNQVSTAKVIRVEQIVYTSEGNPPLDDGRYYSLVKVIARNGAGQSKQFIFHNVRLFLNQRDLSSLIRRYLKVAGQPVEGVLTVLWKK
jgi:hypothetical protein